MFLSLKTISRCKIIVFLFAARLFCLCGAGNVDISADKLEIYDKLKNKFVGYASFGPLANALESYSDVISAVSPSINTIVKTLSSLVGGASLPGISKTDNFCVLFVPLNNTSISFVCLLNAKKDSQLIKLATQFNGAGVFLKNLSDDWYIISDNKAAFDIALDYSNYLIKLANLENDGSTKINVFESLWNGKFNFIYEFLKKYDSFSLAELVLRDVSAAGVEIALSKEDIIADIYFVTKARESSIKYLGGHVRSSQWLDCSSNFTSFGAIKLRQPIDYTFSKIVEFSKVENSHKFPILKAAANCWPKLSKIIYSLDKGCGGEFSAFSNFLPKGRNINLEYVSIIGCNLSSDNFLKLLCTLFEEIVPEFIGALKTLTNGKILANCLFLKEKYSIEGIKIHELNVFFKNEDSDFILNQKSFISIANGHILITDNKGSTENYIRALLGNKKLSDDSAILSIGQMLQVNIDSKSLMRLLLNANVDKSENIVKIGIYNKSNRFYTKITSNMNVVKAFLSARN